MNGWDESYSRHETPPDFSRCGARVWREGAWSSSQCANKAKVDPNEDGKPTRCKMHGVEGVKAREARNLKKEMERRDREFLRLFRHPKVKPLINALIAISEGHNDPRALAKETLTVIERK